MKTRLPPPAVLFPLALAVLAAGLLLTWPVLANDTDLWFHLNAGRYILSHWAVPRESFFSFLAPPRVWTDYHWLFQAVSYGVFSAGGYWGIILLRAACLAAALGVVLRFLLHGESEERLPYASFLAVLFVMLLVPRFVVARPHLFSYPFLALTLFVLDRRHSWAASLPVIAVLWGNLHGVYYPIAELAFGAYLCEHFLPWGKPPAAGRMAPRTLALAALGAAALLLTPCGADLLDKPFFSFDYTNRQILESLPITPSSLVSFSFADGAPTHESLSNLLLWTSVLCAVLSVANRSWRASHLLLFGGGLVLLGKGDRFRYDLALLSLPLLSANPVFAREGWRRLLPAPARAAVLTCLLIVPPIYLVSGFRNPPRYPFSTIRLPSGNAAFLRRADTGGTVLNSGDTGGYLEWALYPRYKIAWDLQVGPLLFGDRDLFMMTHVFLDGKVLRRMVDDYHPDYICAPLRQPELQGLLRAHPQYVPVFFDDAEVLYADRTRQPKLAAEFLLPLDPYAAARPFSLPLESCAAAGSPLPGALERMLGIDPDAITTRVLAGRCALERKDPAAALAHAAAGIRSHPEAFGGFALRALALRAQGSFEPAIASLRTALEKTDAKSRRWVVSQLSETLKGAGRSDEAVQALREGGFDVPPDDWLLSPD